MRGAGQVNCDRKINLAGAEILFMLGKVFFHPILVKTDLKKANYSYRPFHQNLTKNMHGIDPSISPQDYFPP